MKWEYSRKFHSWFAHRPMDENNPGGSDFIYQITGTKKTGYIAKAQNNGYGAMRVAVNSQDCYKASVFYSLKELKENIENGTQLWLYTGACNCVGKVTTEEY